MNEDYDKYNVVKGTDPISDCIYTDLTSFGLVLGGNLDQKYLVGKCNYGLYYYIVIYIYNSELAWLIYAKFNRVCCFFLDKM